MNKKVKKYQLLALASLSGILLSLAWPDRGFAPLLLIAFVPLLWVENYLHSDQEKRFGRFSAFFYSYPAFLIWNVLTTYWVWNATPVALLAFVLNALFMALSFQLFFFVRKKYTFRGRGYHFLPVCWIAFEYLHMNWDGSWPWLSLGNGFASMPMIVQWYQFTGMLGGSLWVLSTNILVFLTLDNLLLRKDVKKMRSYLIALSSLIVLPVLFSLYLYWHYEEPKDAKPVQVVVVQPNVDPYSEQYDLDHQEITNRLLDLAKEKTTDSTAFIITPESSIQEYLFEDQILGSSSFDRLQSFVSNYKQAAILVGMPTRRILPKGVKTAAMRKLGTHPDLYYECYNSAVLIGKDVDYQLLHKSKLTPGVECMPLQKQLPFIRKLALNLGGTVGSLGIDENRKLFYSPETQTKVASLICYESIYGDYVSQYVRKGAELLFVITNDAWWGDTPGYRQHFQYGRLRAIENRKWIARSANTGISAFISPKGDVYQKTNYWEPAVIEQTLWANSIQTVYSLYGDFLGRIALVYFIFYFFIIVVLIRIAKKIKK